MPVEVVEPAIPGLRIRGFRCNDWRDAALIGSWESYTDVRDSPFHTYPRCLTTWALNVIAIESMLES